MSIRPAMPNHHASMGRQRRALIAAMALAALIAASAVTTVLSSTTAQANPPLTADTANLKTWWHSNGELNASSPVSAGGVRQSTSYKVNVADAGPSWPWYDSFTYMSIPRGGKGKPGYSDPSLGYYHVDGAEFASDAHLTMSWSSFLYATDVWVDVTLTTGQTISSKNQVTIRPRHLNFETVQVGSSTIRIKVPYAESGYRFSVEFEPQLYTVYDETGALNAGGQIDPTVVANREPRNSMMVFAEPIPTGNERNRVVPQEWEGTIYRPTPGQVTNLHNVNADVIYFEPGTYYMGTQYHVTLPSRVRWVYVAPGAYVKGAFQFPYDGGHGVYKVTGFGVISGEQYVYESDLANGYNRRAQNSSNCHSTCVKMLRVDSQWGNQQYLDLHGVTIAEPPYHSYVTYGDEATFEMRVEHFKQVGAWYWQTDGLELYRGSRMRDTFFNANDDVLKLYHSGVSIENTVVWKFENGPVIQWGWGPRNIDGVTVRGTHVIHNRLHPWAHQYNTCVLNSSSHWADMAATNTADTGQWVRNLLIEDTTVEGPVNCAIRLYAQANTENIEVRNLSIDGWDRPVRGGSEAYRNQYSWFEAYTNQAGQTVTIGNEHTASRGLKLNGYRVGGVSVEKWGGNWQADQRGRLNFSGALWENWNAWS